MSFQQGLSGLNAASKNLAVIGNNVANASTVGAKVSRAEFGDMYASAIGGAGGQTVGIGVSVNAVTQQFSQGNFSTTENSLDLAINGAGFFTVLDTSSGQTLYTRNGQFQQDKDGFIVNNEGRRLQGYPADATGAIMTGAASALRLPTTGINPKVTSDVQLELNLDARGAVTMPAGGGIDIADSKTYNNATSVTVYDKQGVEVPMTFYFQKSLDQTGSTARDEWNVYATANGQLVSATPLTTVSFNASGLDPQFTPAAPQDMDLASLGVNIDPNSIALNMSNVTNYGSQFAVTEASQNGFAGGKLTKISIDGTGVVMASYSDGQTKAAGQVQLANFRNPQGLAPLGGNVWAQTYASGEPVRGVPGSGNLGVLKSGALEESNVDLTAELVNMMTAQRVYQANSQTIKTQDSILQTLVSMR